MSDKIEGNGSASAPADLRLAREIRNLRREMEPSRDLWPGIERRIAEHPQRGSRDRRFDWMPYGVAASLVLATAAFVFSLMPGDPFAPELVSYDRSIDQMQAEYLRVRNPLVQEFTETNRNLDPETMDELYRNIEIMEQARREIEEAVRKNPENRRLVEMLMAIHEQELELLKRDYMQPTRSM